MSTFDTDDSKREIIIVRRARIDDEEGHHGGVWKIAFADFMTAMMCFFLVMWLVNATNEQTKAAIASYFNPMTLVDTNPGSKGLDDPGEVPPSRDGASEERRQDSGAERSESDASPRFARSLDQDETRKTSDQHLFSDPYAVLAEIAAQTSTLQNISAKGDGGAQTSGPATGAQGGESYRDPFAPDFWSQEIAGSQDAAEFDAFRQPQGEQAASVQQPEGGKAESQSTATAETPAPTPASRKAEQMAEKIRTDIAAAFSDDPALNQAISVTAESGGVLISVTEEFDFGMFEVGSAVPKRELVLAMEKLGHMLNQLPGRLRINGHTDGRPFRNQNYDNWRLSTARAHSAYYMLARTGLDEARIKEVAGFADRQLKLTDDPFASVNRRIEVFLETDG